MEFAQTQRTCQMKLLSQHHKSSHSVFVETGCGTTSHSHCMSLRDLHSIELNSAPDEWFMARLHGSLPCACKTVLPSHSEPDPGKLRTIVF